jgi:hypothetical protein
MMRITPLAKHPRESARTITLAAECVGVANIPISPVRMRMIGKIFFM